MPATLAEPQELKALPVKHLEEGGYHEEDTQAAPARRGGGVGQNGGGIHALS